MQVTTCSECKNEKCSQHGKPNPWMQPGACASNPDNKRTDPDKPRSGYQPVDDDDDPYDILKNWWGQINNGDEFVRDDGRSVRIEVIRNDGWICLSKWASDGSLHELLSIPVAVFHEELLRYGMVRK